MTALLVVLAGCFPEVAIQAPPTGENCAWYPDSDGDGVGGDAPQVAPCADPPADHVAVGGDCDDTNAAVFPGAEETCDGTDEDCDGQVDEAGGSTWYRDGDGDGFGDTSTGVTACDAPPGTISRGGDCDDADADVNPAATEVWYDGVDADCAGDSDDDADQDGYDAAARGGDDCDDADPDRSPAEAEVWYDGVDADCDGSSDFDADRDGFDADTHGGWDCDDADASVHPGSDATELPGDGVDTDCDGLDRCTDLSCDGRPDLVLAGFEGPDGAIAPTGLWFSTADGTDASRNAWGAAADRTLTPGAVSAVLAEDLDDDGYVDLVLAVHHDATAEATDSWIYWGSAAGHADADRTALPTEAASAVCAGDFDGDGAVDLFFPGWSADTATEVDSVLVLDAAGAAVVTGLRLVRSRACAFVDLDGDGADELVTGRWPDDAGRVSTAVGAALVDRDATGAIEVTSIAAGHVRRVVVEDFDRDGTPEVVLVDRGRDDALDVARTHVMRWTGSALTTWDVLATEGAVDAATCDANGDGDPDLVVLSGVSAAGDLASDATRAWLGDGASLTPASAAGVDTVGASRLSVADLTGDGLLDLVISDFVDDAGSREQSVRLVSLSADGTMGAAAPVDLPVSGGNGHVLADLDGDGDLDVLTSAWADDAGSGRVDSFIYWNGGAGTLGAAFDPGDRAALRSTAVWADPVVVP